MKGQNHTFSVQFISLSCIKAFLQTMEMEQRRHCRRRELFVVQIVILLTVSLVYYQRMFFVADQVELVERNTVTVNNNINAIRPPKHWTLTVREEDNELDCQISTTPILQSSNSSLPLVPAEQYSMGTRKDKEQYVLHIHGLHHTGTGYLRQTLHDALHEAFSKESGNITAVASMQDSLRPYQELFANAGKNKNKRNKLYKRYHKPEDEGQHLQSIYPTFAVRYSKMKKAKGSNKYNHLSYIADTCVIINSEHPSDELLSLSESSDTLRLSDKYKRIGTELFRQWSQYWDTSAKFLLQKSPMLDVLFLEQTKILPTLHIIVIRHPMASNSWGITSMGYLWLRSWMHVFKALGEQKVEWYAVVTYEALVSHHDQVVEELLEVVRSGMSRYRTRHRRNLVEEEWSTVNNAEYLERTSVPLRVDPRDTIRSTHRRLELHGTASDEKQSKPTSYLKPKPRSIQLWKKCLGQKQCAQILTRLTKDVFPYLGYESNGRPLSKSPGTVTVREEFGRVLFTSEGEALNRLRQRPHDTSAQHIINYIPTPEFISKLKKSLG